MLHDCDDTTTMIERTFQDLPDSRNDGDAQDTLAIWGWSRGFSWNDLLQSKRILLVSEAGTGKTYECRDRAARLWRAEEPAFFVALDELANAELPDLLDPDQITRLEAWRAAQSDMATFFLDSIDELRLTHRAFARALKRLRAGIGNRLHRVRIVLTTRPIPFDEQCVRDLLPVSPGSSSKSKEDEFAAIAMGGHQEPRGIESEDRPPVWRAVTLLPLSDEQIVAFSRAQGVDDPERLLEDLQHRNAQEFARRPQDLIELCADWRVHQRVRTHREQVEANVRIKLLPREDRPELAELSGDQAIDGASRLALATQVTRRLTIRHSAEADVNGEEAALDPAIILSDWDPNVRKALLERPLFGFASYGRVRFHHRSVAEYLAAQRLLRLRERGMPFRSLERLLFVETRGRTIVRPSRRPVAAWLALQEPGIFELLRDKDPAVLLNEGDPGSLTQSQRNQALRAFTDRYGSGGWRGLQVPGIQVYRFASPELADEIQRIWDRGVENPDVRKVLINLVGAGRIDACADIAFAVTQDIKAPVVERMMALDALIALNDNRVSTVAARIADGDDLWPDQAAQGAIIRLFPQHLLIGQLCQALQWTARTSHRGDDLVWQLPRQIMRSNLDRPALEELRDGLVSLVSEGLDWHREWGQITSDRSHLCSALAATCERGLGFVQDDKWLHACVLAVRLHDRDHCNEEPIRTLRDQLGNLDADDNARLFWVSDTLMQSVAKINDPWERLARMTVNGGSVQLRPGRDWNWVRDALGETTHDTGTRAMLLEAAIRLVPDCCTRQEHYVDLKCRVADHPEFIDRIDDWVKTSSNIERQQRRWKTKDANRQKTEERRKTQAYSSWIAFWREVADHPEDAFSSEKSDNTAWNLWRAMRRDGDNSRSSGWNRRFMEEQFGHETADRLRLALMQVWRNEYPTLPSERPEDQRNIGSEIWQLGLAGIYSEAEDPDWAHQLSETDACRAVRYAPVELNGLPQWMEALAEGHPAAVDKTLGHELSWELRQPPSAHSYSQLLQGIFHAPEGVAKLFLPHLESWLHAGADIVSDARNAPDMAARIRQVTQVLWRHGDDVAQSKLLETAHQRLKQQVPPGPLAVWLATVMRLDPATGIKMLEDRVSAIAPAEQSDAVKWMASLFGDQEDTIDLSDPRLTPQLLLRLVRLAYQHVRVADDAQHTGSYVPDVRDNAERARNNIVTALLNTTGEDGRSAKLEMADDPLCAHFKDRILEMTAERWAREIDTAAFDEVQAAALDRSGEAPASTKEVMFAIMKDRLSDLDELLLRDDSPREAWAGISVERVMRRQIARELRYAANAIYTVDQEAVTGEEKETDIRLRSTVSSQEAVIEIKLGDKKYWSARKLRETIQDQLVSKYMMAENCRAGALMVTLATDRKWRHPDENRNICADELLALLRAEAERVQAAHQGGILIHVHFLDLRPPVAF